LFRSVLQGRATVGQAKKAKAKAKAKAKEFKVKAKAAQAVKATKQNR
jgi:hypothetical protein